MDDKQISNNVRILFAVHMVVAGVIGAAMWIIPGRTLTAVGWIPEMREISPEISLPGTMFFDAIQARLIGAALLALAYSSFRGWRADRWAEISILVTTEALFCLLGTLAVLHFVLTHDLYMPGIIWALLIILVAFAIGWGLVWRNERSA